jgi:hypothetical protein
MDSLILLRLKALQAAAATDFYGDVDAFLEHARLIYKWLLIGNDNIDR